MQNGGRCPFLIAYNSCMYEPKVLQIYANTNKIYRSQGY